MNDDRGAVESLLVRLLFLLAPAASADLIIGDLDEAYERRRRGPLATGARQWYRRQLVLALVPWRLAALRELHRETSLGAHARHRRRSFGGVPSLGRGLAAGLADLRYSLRLLLRSPGFTALTVLVMAGGLGVSVFTFSFLNTVMFKELPLPDGGSIVRVMAIIDGRTQLLDSVDAAVLGRSVDGLREFGSYRTLPVVLRGSSTDRSMYGTYIHTSVFEFSGALPLLGRGLRPGDALPAAEPVVVISHRVWQASFGADPEMVDRLVSINGKSTRLIGVMPQGYGFPVFAEMWLPQPEHEIETIERGIQFPNLYAKLGPGVNEDQANAELHAVMQRLRQDEPEAVEAGTSADTAVVRTFQIAQMGDEAMPVFGALHLVAAFILLLACINTCNLLLARASERVRETTIRVALGAPRLRLIVQMMGESMLICVMSGGLAIALAAVALAEFNRRAHVAMPEGLAFWWVWGMDAETMVAAALITAGTLVLVGGVPAWRGTRSDSNAVLRDGTNGAQGLETGRFSRVLVVSQVALISILMFLGGLSAFVAYRAANIDFGMDTERVVVGIVTLPEERYETAEQRLRFYDRLRQGLEAHGSIDKVVLRSRFGLGSDSASRLVVEGASYETLAQQPTAYLTAVGGPMHAIGIRLLSGRRFDERDAAGAPVAMISESLARDMAPEGSPLGKRLSLGDLESERYWLTVVGVVTDVVEGNPLTRDQSSMSVYVPIAQRTPAAVAATVKYRGDPRPAVLAFHAELGKLDPEILPGGIINLDEMLSTTSSMALAAARVLLGCFGFALVLAISGIYGITARSVSQRTHEIGVRRAVGASDQRIIRLFLRHGGRQLVVGLGLAAIAGGLASAVLEQFLALDTVIYVVSAVLVPALIGVIVLLAIYLPTSRAVRLEPSAALWRE